MTLRSRKGGQGSSTLSASLTPVPSFLSSARVSRTWRAPRSDSQVEQRGIRVSAPTHLHSPWLSPLTTTSCATC
jgi:hypothetical protein